MTTLGVDAFPQFFEDVYGFEPFPWQARLVREIADDPGGRWPQLLDLPTGTGKTAAIDVAVFLLAMGLPLPRRIVFVVDRRIIVHQAARRAQTLAKALDAPDRTPLVAEVSDGLRRLAVDEADAEAGPPLRWSELRGGIVRDETWAMRPDVPAVLVSTVDQVGSRLLFRGYGVSTGMRPIHAGLLGNDCLFLLDEVHLAHPFRTTLRSIAERFRPSAEIGLPDRWQVVELSATPSGADPAATRFGLDEADRDPVRTPVLVRRLRARKPAEVKLVGTRGKDEEAHQRALAEVAAAEALALSAGGVRTVGVIVNRVATAVAVHRLLDGSADRDVLLLTGRMRPFDRDDLLAGIEERIRTGRIRSAEDRPLILVATQAVEAGADLDLDALITECAPLDALRQRFGRVDRDGRQADEGDPPTSVILATSSAVANGATDPIYGDALRHTWASLQDRPLDFGYETGTLDDLSARSEELGLVVSPPSPPELLPSHLDRWVQTSEPPDGDPNPAQWLHGVVSNVEDVNVVWRADVTAEALRVAAEAAMVLAGANGSSPARLTAGVAAERSTAPLQALLAAAPIRAAETMAVPPRAVRRWLASMGPVSRRDGIGGTEFSADATTASGADDDDRVRARTPIAPAVVLAHDDVGVASVAGDIRPGATIVVPASYGGVHAGTFDPVSTDAPHDLATRANAVAGRGMVLRLIPGTISLPDGPDDAMVDVPVPICHDDDDPDADADEERVRSWLVDVAERIDASSGPSNASRSVEQQVLIELAREARADLERAQRGQSRRRSRLLISRFATMGPVSEDGVVTPSIFVVSSTTRFAGVAADGASVADGATDPVDSEPETSSFLGRAVSLDEHLGDVERWAGRLAGNCGLAEAVRDDIALAGRLHDLGKADPRFQLLLRAGEIGHSSEGSGLLAKSAVPATDSKTRKRAEAAAGYPRGARHEMMSVAFVEGDARLRQQANDWDLVLHLVASHHGHARPTAPVVIDHRPIDVVVAHDGAELHASTDHGLARFDSGVSDRFWLLVRRYGWWGLAWMEAVLRLADHRASAAEQRVQDDALEVPT